MTVRAQHLNQAVIKRVALLAAALALGFAPTPAELEAVPEQVVGDLLEDDFLDGMEEADREALLRLFSIDPRPEVRLRVARHLGERPLMLSPQVEAAIVQLTSDPSAQVRRAAQHGFHRLLKKVDGIDRMRVVCEWALSPNTQKRLALAWALRLGLTTPAADAAARLLRGDADPEVRAALG